MKGYRKMTIIEKNCFTDVIYCGLCGNMLKSHVVEKKNTKPVYNFKCGACNAKTITAAKNLPSAIPVRDTGAVNSCMSIFRRFSSLNSLIVSTGTRNRTTGNRFEYNLFIFVVFP